jgi:hypothetical protein
MNWGKSIVLSFILFGTFIGVLVAVCLNQDTPLVSKQYYQDELKYDDQLQKINNTNQLPTKPEIKVDGNALHITYAHFAKIENGKIKLFRPSDATLDREFKVLSLSDSPQVFVLDNLKKGLYHAQFSWKQDNKEYYLEKTIVL